MNLNLTFAIIQIKYQREKTDKNLELNVWLSVLGKIVYEKY